MIKQANELEYVLCGIESNHIGAKEDMKMLAMEAEDQRKNIYEQKQMRDDNKRLKGLETCEVLVFQFWHFTWITSITSN